MEASFLDRANGGTVWSVASLLRLKPGDDERFQGCIEKALEAKYLRRPHQLDQRQGYCRQWSPIR